MGVQEVIHFQKIVKKLEYFSLFPHNQRKGLLNFFHNLLSTLYNKYFTDENRLCDGFQFLGLSLPLAALAHSFFCRKYYSFLNS